MEAWKTPNSRQKARLLNVMSLGVSRDRRNGGSCRGSGEEPGGKPGTVMEEVGLLEPGSAPLSLRQQEDRVTANRALPIS